MPIYIVDEWFPFPTSEYGGIIVVRARDRIALAKTLLAYESEYRIEKPGTRGAIHAAAKNATEVSLEGPDEILESFRT